MVIKLVFLFPFSLSLKQALTNRKRPQSFCCCAPECIEKNHKFNLIIFESEVQNPTLWLWKSRLVNNSSTDFLKCSFSWWLCVKTDCQRSYFWQDLMWKQQELNSPSSEITSEVFWFALLTKMAMPYLLILCGTYHTPVCCFTSQITFLIDWKISQRANN